MQNRGAFPTIRGFGQHAYHLFRTRWFVARPTGVANSGGGATTLQRIQPCFTFLAIIGRQQTPGLTFFCFITPFPPVWAYLISTLTPSRNRRIYGRPRRTAAPKSNPTPSKSFFFFRVLLGVAFARSVYCPLNRRFVCKLGGGALASPETDTRRGP